MIFLGTAKFYPLLLFSDVLCRHSPWNAWSPSKGSYQITSKKSQFQKLSILQRNTPQSWKS